MADLIELAERVERATRRAEERAGELPAAKSVKLCPEDWHVLTRLAREAAATLRALSEKGRE